MSSRIPVLFLLLVLNIIWPDSVEATATSRQEHPTPAHDPEQLGAISFQTSCSTGVQPRFERALAMLHSFWYEEAAEQFRAILETDKNCAIAWWGLAMSHWQPLWEPRGPNAEAFRTGLDAIRQARQRGADTRHETGLIAALEHFYEDAASVDHRDRVLAYEEAMSALHAERPEDTEVRVLYALSLLGSATSLPTDKEYKRQRKSGELLSEVIQVHPEHPGATHYLIHAYDYPRLARKALNAARRYAQIAPDSPHAQHMPSHIFTRLGLWEESIASNRRVIEVARKYGVVGEELHGMDYLVFAHLQKGEDAEARQVIEAMPDIDPDAPLHFAGLYSHAAVPARYAIERRQWQEAARLPEPDAFPGGRYAWANAAVHFARALGFARSGKVVQARTETEVLEELRDDLVAHEEDYWATQVDIQRLATEAWVLLAEGHPEQALQSMQAAVDLEETTEKHPVTPGQIVPARDLLGQMYLELEQPEEALDEFEKVLQAEPGRFGALYGAGRAAELSGETALAVERYTELLDLAPSRQRPELQRAEAFVTRLAAEPSA